MGRRRGASGAPLAIGVLDVEPDDVVRNVVLVEASIHCQRVRLVVVVPPALVVPAGGGVGAVARHTFGGVVEVGGGRLVAVARQCSSTY